MLTGVENCARTPPMLLPVDPLPSAVSRSITRTFLQPAATRWYAMLEPTIPPPMRTTSAVCMSVVRFRDALQEVAAARATLANTTTANHPNTTANAVPRLTLLMQVIPMAVRTKVQMVTTSNGVSSARSTAEPLGSMKYPGLV